MNRATRYVAHPNGDSRCIIRYEDARNAKSSNRLGRDSRPLLIWYWCFEIAENHVNRYNSLTQWENFYISAYATALAARFSSPSMKQCNRMSFNCYAVGIKVPDYIIGSKSASAKNDFVNIFAGKKGAFEVMFLNFDRKSNFAINCYFCIVGCIQLSLLRGG